MDANDNCMMTATLPDIDLTFDSDVEDQQQQQHDTMREYVVEHLQKEEASREPGFDDGNGAEEEDEAAVEEEANKVGKETADQDSSDYEEEEEEIQPRKRRRRENPADDRIKMTFQWSFEADAKSVHVQNILRQLGNCMQLQNEMRRLQDTSSIHEEDVEPGMTSDQLERWAVQEDFAAMQHEKKRKRNPFVFH